MEAAGGGELSVPDLCPSQAPAPPKLVKRLEPAEVGGGAGMRREESSYYAHVPLLELGRRQGPY